MNIFLSYLSRNRALVEPIYLALRAQRHKVFFDRTDLPPGEEYDIRIRQAKRHPSQEMTGKDGAPAVLIRAGSFTMATMRSRRSGKSI
jgi:hypothetical protein